EPKGSHLEEGRLAVGRALGEVQDAPAALAHDLDPRPSRLVGDEVGARLHVALDRALREAELARRSLEAPAPGPPVAAGDPLGASDGRGMGSLTAPNPKRLQAFWRADLRQRLSRHARIKEECEMRRKLPEDE